MWHRVTILILKTNPNTNTTYHTNPNQHSKILDYGQCSVMYHCSRFVL